MQLPNLIIDSSKSNSTIFIDYYKKFNVTLDMIKSIEYPRSDRIMFTVNNHSLYYGSNVFETVQPAYIINGFTNTSQNTIILVCVWCSNIHTEKNGDKKYSASQYKVIEIKKSQYHNRICEIVHRKRTLINKFYSGGHSSLPLNHKYSSFVYRKSTYSHISDESIFNLFSGRIFMEPLT